MHRTRCCLLIVLRHSLMPSRIRLLTMSQDSVDYAFLAGTPDYLHPEVLRKHRLYIYKHTTNPWKSMPSRCVSRNLWRKEDTIAGMHANEILLGDLLNPPADCSESVLFRIYRCTPREVLHEPGTTRMQNRMDPSLAIAPSSLGSDNLQISQKRRIYKARFFLCATWEYEFHHWIQYARA